MPSLTAYIISLVSVAALDHRLICPCGGFPMSLDSLLDGCENDENDTVFRLMGLISCITIKSI